MTKQLSKTLMLNFFVVSVDPLLPRDTPKTNHNSGKTGENIATQDGRHGHCAPVLRETADTERVSDQGWEDAEEKAICDSCETRDENQCVRVVYAGAGKLGSGEDDCGNEQAPKTRHVQFLDQKV